ncbi:hypothetical protein JB92DRAFT_3134404 [Gautieria morchelliformis]|nr:hypothetical protein JB92DRAFT_3134404 [Gautieria morchelliformis]
MQAGLFVPPNSFSSLVIGGLIKVNGVHVPPTLSKGISKPTETLIVPEEQLGVVGALPPVRPPSKLPPPGNLCLRVSLDSDRLGHGRVGAVYPLRVDGADQYALPPLVIKIAARRRSEDLAREAWFYEELEHIQGVAIARCYGLFTTEIDPNSEVLGWAESDADHEEEEEDLDENSQIQDGGDSDDSLSHRWDPKPLPEPSADDLVNGTVGWEYFNARTRLRHPREDKRISIPKSTRTVQSPAPNSSEKTILSVLVLERLGDHLPIGVSMDTIKLDVLAIYSDMGRFGVEHMDIAWRNIVAAPATQESIVCPYHGHKHQWRIVDFDRSRKSNFPLDQIEYGSNSWLRNILKNLAKGYVVDPEPF